MNVVGFNSILLAILEFEVIDCKKGEKRKKWAFLVIREAKVTSNRHLFLTRVFVYSFVIYNFV